MRPGRPTLLAMAGIRVEWVRQHLQGGTPLERWHAHLVKPFESREFAWLIRRNGLWHLDVMLGDSGIRKVASYRSPGPAVAMRHVERWIAARGRWERLVLARGAEDPRGKYSRFAPSPAKHYVATQIREMYRFNPPRSGPMPGSGPLPKAPMPSASIEEELAGLCGHLAD